MSGGSRAPDRRTRPSESRSRAKSRLNLGARFAYVDCAETAGPLVQPAQPHQPVVFRHVASVWARLVLTLLVLLNLAAGLLFVGWLLLPQHVPGAVAGIVGWDDWRINLARIGFCLVIGVELIRLLQNVAVWMFAFRAKDPVPMDPPVGLRVAMLTTIVPSKEPIDVVARTLRQMKNVVYCGDVDIWILDEGDDPRVKAMAAELGVRHFSRKDRPEYNQPAGEFRTKTKSGNHNAWRAEHEHDYDVVAQMDPDHVPMPGFLERTLGYFRDPDVAFVVAPQVYGNMYENWVSHGASVQQYLFSGLVERGGNGMDAPLLIGTNHLYRPSAWRQIGGYQDSIIEDHVTSMRVQASVNCSTTNRWKGVYTPDVVAIGEGPTSWADYFNQQKRWAFGIWEILLRRELGQPRELRTRQRLLYSLVQFYYPSVAASVLLGNLATALYMFFGVGSVEVAGDTWLLLWSTSMTTWFMLWFFLRRYNIAEHEREEVGMMGMALALFAGPVYLSAAVSALLRRKLAYAVTAKGKLRTTESLSTFRLHLLWALLGGGMLGASFWLEHDQQALRVWSGLTLFAGLAPPIISLGSSIAASRRRARAERAAARLASQVQAVHVEAARAGMPVAAPGPARGAVVVPASAPARGAVVAPPSAPSPARGAAVAPARASAAVPSPAAPSPAAAPPPDRVGHPAPALIRPSIPRQPGPRSVETLDADAPLESVPQW